jgi:hypothetical protein
MNSLLEIENERETKLKSARLEDGFYNIIGGRRIAAVRELANKPVLACQRRQARTGHPHILTT